MVFQSISEILRLNKLCGLPVQHRYRRHSVPQTLWGFHARIEFPEALNRYSSETCEAERSERALENGIMLFRRPKRFSKYSG